MSSPRICKSCSEPIYGDFINAINATWHPAHFCCAVCQQPVTEGRFYIHEQQPCHNACYEQHIAPHCSICDKALTGKHQVDYWGERYCIEHGDSLVSCSYCGRLVAHATKRTRRRSAENISCDTCNSTAITTNDEAKQILPHLIAWAERQGMRLRNKNFRIEVLDRTELATRQGGHRDPLGVTTTTRFMRTKNVVDYMKIDGVAILKGLPVALFEGVCTHELGHIWLAQHSVVNLPLVDEEGFCELLAHSRYTAIGSKTDLFYARRIAENQSPVYGAGFRKLKKLEARIGFEAILKALQRKKKLPL